ncbi:MAG: gliding motility protein GldH [Chitinophagaceae bacterium]|nr:gliding motility protein GldH [Chitinophagaceae bacterium]
MKMKPLFLLFTLLIFAAGCGHSDVFEKIHSFPKHEWLSSETPAFKFEVQDTASAYQLFLVLRHTDAYHFKNIWLQLHIQAPDSSYTINREFTLADNNKWLGAGMDDIYEHRILFSPQPIKLNKGSYTFRLQHIMREDPLLNVMNAGIRIQKINQ